MVISKGKETMIRAPPRHFKERGEEIPGVGGREPSQESDCATKKGKRRKTDAGNGGTTN